MSFYKNRRVGLSSGMARPRLPNKRQKITAYIDDAVADALRGQAVKEQRTISIVIERMIRDGLAAAEKAEKGAKKG
jgi:hypothetical protein